MCHIERIIILQIIVIITCIDGQLIGAKRYFDVVNKRMVRYLKDDKILVDKNFPVNSGTSFVNVTLYGKEAIGNVSFHSGFVASIESATIVDKSYNEIVGDEESYIMANFLLLEVVVALEVHYKLENNIVGDAIFRIKYGNVNYEITISRKHNERNVKGSIKFVGVCGFGHGQWDMEIQTYPRTTEIQLIGQHYRKNQSFRSPFGLEAGFSRWAATLQPMLNKAIKDLKYPNINYDNSGSDEEIYIVFRY